MGSEQTEKSIEKIDLTILISDFRRAARRMLMPGILLAAVLAAFFCWREYRSYSPQYQASASFTVYVTNPLQAEVRTYNTATAEQMQKTFPYILTSGALSDMVKQELGISVMPQVTASVLENTNIFTLTVTSSDPQLAYDVLNAVITYYPSVAEFVVGPTEMNLLDESGLPTEPVNHRNFPSAVKKGVTVAVVIWLAAVLLLAFGRSTIHNQEELKRLVNLHCIGMLPVVKRYQKGNGKFAYPDVTAKEDPVGFGESVRLLRIRVEKEMQKENKQVILISSAIPGEGKTTVASNLALSLAQKGSRTLLVDCDLRSPMIAQVLGEENAAPGLSDYLKGNATAKEIIHPVKYQQLFAVYGGSSVSDAAELLTTKKTRAFLSSARKIFDYVILDTPPCSLLADAAELADLADCALMTIRQDYASRNQILDGVQRLSDNGMPLIGCVLNGVSQSALGKSYGYYGYGDYYGSYKDSGGARQRTGSR